MPKTALVLSGGGAKGAFQVMAEKYAREVKGYHWDLIAGVSVGALNAVMLGMEKYQRLEEIWKTIDNDQVYTGRLNFWAGARILFGARSIYGNRPLWKLIQREIDPSQVTTDVRIGTVSLKRGDYQIFRPQDPGFLRAVLASTAIPIVWQPVDVSPRHPEMADGGLRNMSPLGDVLDAEPDEVIIINCEPTEPSVWEKPLNSIFAIGRRTLDVVLNEIFVNDLREFLRINRNVAEASARGVLLHNENGKPFKHYRYRIIQPDRSLGDTMDFSPATVRRIMEAGWEKAREVLDQPPPGPAPKPARRRTQRSAVKRR